MSFWARYKMFLQACGAGLLLLLLVWLVFARRFAREQEELEAGYVRLHQEYLKEFRLGGRISDNIATFTRTNAELRRQLSDAKQMLDMPFDKWVTSVPATESWGAYFQSQYERLREDLGRTCSGRGVELLDRDIGFRRNPVVDDRSGRENLRKLAIVEKMMRLLIGVEVEKIVYVRPQEAEDRGAVDFQENRDYKPGSRVPREREHWLRINHPVMLREYPVEIAVVTRLKPLLEFLKSVRQEKQVLVIRSLNLMSRNVGAMDQRENNTIIKELKDDELFVTISAAGMAFYKEEDLAARHQVEQRAVRQVNPADIQPAGN